MLYLDFETRSRCDLRSAGAYAYASHPSTRAILLAWAIDDQPVRLWECLREPMPGRLRLSLSSGRPIVAHNAQFDRLIMDHVVGFPTTLGRWRCSSVRALAHGLPGSLGELSAVLDLKMAKLEVGKVGIATFSLPRKDGQFDEPGDQPAKWDAFQQYAIRDVEAMRELWRKLPGLNYPDNRAELDLYHLDQLMNDRGLPVDHGLVRGAQAVVDRALEGINEQLSELTEGAVSGVNDINNLKRWLATQGLAVDSLTKDQVDDLIDDPATPNTARQALALRQAGAKTSTAKFNALTAAKGADGRVRGTLQFCGASRTGRWAGRIFQPQNLPRQDEDFDVDSAVAQLLAGEAPPDPMHAASQCVRAVIAPPPGSKLVVSDLSNIEGRVLAWLGGERWKLDAFAAYDAGAGADLYKVAYGRSFGVHPDAVTKPQRQVGKVMELALGYEGGVGAFVTMAAGYGMDLEALYEIAWPAANERYQERAERALRWYRANHKFDELSDEAVLACSVVKYGWRDAHAGIVGWWAKVDGAARAALNEPGQTFSAGRVRFSLRKIGDVFYLLCRLPSGRFLCYARPGLRDATETTIDPDTGEETTRDVSRISYYGTDSRSGGSRRFHRVYTYSGKLAENITQAVARDVLAHAMPAAELAGYQLVGTVHDELIAEAPVLPEYNARDLSGLLSIPPDWADSLPLAAAGYQARRYKKG